jgi:AcrR family transcriptional regulator
MMNSLQRRRRYRQVARAEGQDQTRSALLDAARREFLAGRFERVSLEQLAGAAGVTKQTLLRHFGSKDGLLEASAQRERERIAAHRFQAPAGDVPGSVENLLAHYEQEGELALTIGALADRGGVLGQIAADAKRLHYEWVEHAFAQQLACVRGAARKRRRAALIAVCDVTTWRVLSHDLGLSEAEVRRTLIEVIDGLVAGRGRDR